MSDQALGEEAPYINAHVSFVADYSFVTNLQGNQTHT